jgi:hypothetical protein
MNTSSIVAARSLSLPGILLRLEGLAVLGAALWLYASGGHNWWLLAALVLAPDLAILAYALGPSRGALAYNLAHTYVGPLALAGLGLAGAGATWLAIALIWLAHIGLDRALGFGLKYPGGFKDTHFARV